MVPSDTAGVVRASQPVPEDLHATMASVGSIPRTALASAYQYVRAVTLDLCRTLEIEDYVIQSMPDVSPTKWHLAHTSWFFETFILTPETADYRVCQPAYEYLFNSYYNAVGPQFSRPHRGILSRPTVREIIAYREHVDAAMLRFLSAPEPLAGQICDRIILGLHHEQQHQELMLMDIKHVFSRNPLHPTLRANAAPAARHAAPPVRWCPGPDGLRSIGRPATDGFCFDNESPRHDAMLHPFELASRCVTNAEYFEFIADGGYRRCEFWLSNGWATVQANGWRAPLYWQPPGGDIAAEDAPEDAPEDASASERDIGNWQHMTLGGIKPVDPHAPVTHVSLYEADAYARWAGARLPTEFEWETMTVGLDPRVGNFADSGLFHPTVAGSGPPDQNNGQDDQSNRSPTQMFGDVWEWTASAYLPYPGYQPAAGAIGEYNGKFMSGQMVLRGGACVTSLAHTRATYRNFFPPEARWPFTGIRLARNA